ncbi:hypothetical protein RUM43_006957 [Polyplax serrata]|uniref:Cytochrome c oxidase assembly protein COX15 homolog n=1 Tax=Polyplax serrata TaxID=468196 RepID=A0AAN8P7Z9_POLSC
MLALKIGLCRSSFPNSFILKSTVCQNGKFSSLNQTTFSPKYKLFQKPVSVNKSNFLIRQQITTVAAKKPINSDVKVGRWLIMCAGMVGGAITLGGYTRLTESGLSMVNWHFTFESAPQTEQDWINEFNKYKEFPEFKQLKSDLTLEQFKSIWTTEFIHRSWGRCIGIFFLIPAVSYMMKGYFNPALKKRVFVFGALIAAQGLLGWYMVKSGLENRFSEPTDIPRVSQYRLAAHLGLALTLYTGLMWTALDLLMPTQTISKALPHLKKLKILANSCKGMVFLTALSGAFVAGLDAGLVYNSFPKMSDKWIPDDIFSLSPMYKNFFENPTTVQFNHRILGISTFTLAVVTSILTRWYTLPQKCRRAGTVLGVAACLQVSLGIATLLHHVPVGEALAHQTGSVLLLTTAIWLAQSLKKIKYVPK